MNSKHLKPKLIEINYVRHGSPFVELVESIEKKNTRFIDDEHGLELAMIQSILNCMYAITSEFAWELINPQIAAHNKARTILFSTIHKNQIAIYTSLKLTRLGLYGPARSMLRHVFVALLTAKFCSVSDDASVFSKWKEGNTVFLSNGVLKKLQKPDTEPFKDFWGLLSEYSHATIYAQQVALNARSTEEDITLNFVFIRILIDCQYHLLSSHLITPSMKYYTLRYRRNKDPLPELRLNMKRLLQESRATLLEHPKSIIDNYRSKWVLST
jgi:hypothetical protein